MVKSIIYTFIYIYLIYIPVYIINTCFYFKAKQKRKQSSSALFLILKTSIILLSTFLRDHCRVQRTPGVRSQGTLGVNFVSATYVTAPNHVLSEKAWKKHLNLLVPSFIT